MADLITSTNPRAFASLGNANNIKTGTNTRTFLASGYIPIVGVLKSGTNPRSFSAFSNTGVMRPGTNPRTFLATGFIVPFGILSAGTNPRKFSATGIPGTVFIARTNTRTFFANGSGQIPIGALLSGTNPRQVSILAAIPESENFTVMVLNLMNKLPSFYSNYNFNSACPFNGGYLAIGPAGIYTLTGDSDSGAPINASILTGDSNYGTDRIKTDPEIFLNYSGGEMQVSVYVDESDQIGPFQVPQPEGNRTQTRRARLPKGLRGSRLQYLIENVNGDSFNFQSADLGMNVSQRRIH